VRPSPAIAVVDDDPQAIEIGTDGVWLDLTLIGTGERCRGRLALPLRPTADGSDWSGLWAGVPLHGEQVAVLLDSADPSSVVVLGSLQDGESDGHHLPTEVVSDPDTVRLRSLSKLQLSAEGTASIDAPRVNLGQRDNAGTKPVARRDDAVSVGDLAWVAFVQAMTLAGLPVPPTSIGGTITAGSAKTFSA